MALVLLVAHFGVIYEELSEMSEQDNVHVFNIRGSKVAGFRAYEDTATVTAAFPRS